jgi:hypothetical protein
VNHDPGIGQAVAFSFRTCGEQERQLLEALRQARSADPRQDWIAAARL